MTTQTPQEKCKNINDNMIAAMSSHHGNRSAKNELVKTILADGHALVEGVPGTGKTQAVKKLAQSITAQFTRIQFTPDLQPFDMTGGDMFVSDPNGAGRWKEVLGPLFSNIVLADEINRATPKTQAGLLEAMGEKQVTLSGRSTPSPLPSVFSVLATQNPIEQEGTNPLPEAQLDRFLTKIYFDPIEDKDEKAVLTSTGEPKKFTPLTLDHILFFQKQAEAVAVDVKIAEYLVALRRATHDDTRVKDKGGVSTRGNQMILKMAKTTALTKGRSSVTAEDVQSIYSCTASHRIILNMDARFKGHTGKDVVESALATVRPPTLTQDRREK